MFLVHNCCCNPDYTEYQGQEWQDHDGPGLTLVTGDAEQLDRDYDDVDHQEEGVGEGDQVCEETGVRGTVIYLCEQQDIYREEDLDQDAEKHKEVLVEGGEPVDEVQQPDQYGGVDHSEGDWN